MRQRGARALRVAPHLQLVTRLAVGVATGVLPTGCDLDSPPPQSNQGPNLQVTRTYPAAGEGMGCTGDPECGVPTTATIELALDRYLLPRTGIRQSVRFRTAGSGRPLFLEPDYDPIERVMIYRPLTELLTDTVYTLDILVPDDESEDGDRNGLRAFDQAPLVEGPVPLSLSFRTRPVRGPTPPPPPPTPTCEEIQEIFHNGCAFGGCHGPCADGAAADACSGPAMGLDLSTTTGWRTTAIGRVAHETEIGPRGGITLQNPSRFGVEMSIIDSGRPSNSYLMYKLLVNRMSYVDASGEAVPAAPTSPASAANSKLAPPETEVARLQDWFISLDPMPPPDAHLDVDSLRKLERWIQAGAPTHDCP